MPNKTKKSQPNRKKKAAPKSNRRMSVPRNISARQQLTHEVCGLTDPFCPHARGAKVPDDSNTNSLTWQSRGIETFTTSAGGERAVIFLPNFKYGPFDLCSTTGGIATSSGAYTTGVAIPAAAQSIRIVSVGIRVKNICAPLSSSGMVHIRCGTELNSLAYTSSTFLAAGYGAGQSQDVPLQDCHDVVVLSPRTSQPRAAFYLVDTIAPTTDPLYWTAPGFSPVVIYVSGAPASTPVIQIEYVINYEMQFDYASGTGQLATSPPPANPVAIAAADRLSSTASSIFTKGTEAFAGYVERKAASYLASYFGGPVGGMLALAL